MIYLPTYLDYLLPSSPRKITCPPNWLSSEEGIRPNVPALSHISQPRFTYPLTWSTRLPETIWRKVPKVPAYLLIRSTSLSEVPRRMCYIRGVVIGTHKKYTKEQAQAYMHDQCNYFNMLMKKVLKKKEYGEEFEYLLSELRDGPYWHLVKYRLTMI